jgi:hypothetical protein
MRPSEGEIVNYRHVASAVVHGPVRVVAVPEGSNQVVVTNDTSLGRTFSLMRDVTVFERVLLPPAEGEVE